MVSHYTAKYWRVAEVRLSPRPFRSGEHLNVSMDMQLNPPQINQSFGIHLVPLQVYFPWFAIGQRNPQSLFPFSTKQKPYKAEDFLPIFPNATPGLDHLPSGLHLGLHMV